MPQSFAEELSWVPQSPGLAVSLERAYGYALAGGHDLVTLEHLLLALSEDRESGVVLAACNVDIERLRADVAAHLGRRGDGDGAGPPVADKPLLKIMKYAAAATQKSARPKINGAVVLAAIVGEGQSSAADLLKGQGLTFDGVIGALRQAAQPEQSQVRQQSQEQPRAPEKTAAPVPADMPAAPSQLPSTDDLLASARAKIQARREAQAAATAKRAANGTAPMESEPQTVTAADKKGAAAASTAAKATPVAAAQAVTSAKADTKLAPIMAAVASNATRPAQEPEPAPVSEPAREPPAAAEPATSPAQPPAAANAPVAPAPQPGAAAPQSGPAVGAQPGQSQVTVPQANPEPQQMPVPSAPARRIGAGAQEPDRRERLQDEYQRRGRDERGHQPDPGPGPIAPWPEPRQPDFQPPPAAPQPAPFDDLAYAPNGNGAPPSEQLAGAPFPSPDELTHAPLPLPQAAAPISARVPMPAPAPAPPPQSAPPQPGRRESRDVEVGQLLENIPRMMRVGVAETVEVRIAREHATDPEAGMQGHGGAHSHDLFITKAMSVKLKAPGGGFWIETTSPETQWIDNKLGVLRDDFASWRWTVTPQRRGPSRLQVVVSARTVGNDGLAAETQFPYQVVSVKVKVNYKKTFKRLGGWALAALFGGAISALGANLLDLGAIKDLIHQYGGSLGL